MLDVDPVDLGADRCGESAVETLLAYHLHAVDHVTAESAAQEDAPQHLSTLEMLLAFRRVGLRSELGSITAEQMLAELAAQRPLIIVVEAAGARDSAPGTEGIKHCWVVRGYDPKTARFIINTPARGPCSVSRMELEARWKQAGNVAIRVLPNALDKALQTLGE